MKSDHVYYTVQVRPPFTRAARATQHAWATVIATRFDCDDTKSRHVGRDGVGWGGVGWGMCAGRGGGGLCRRVGRWCQSGHEYGGSKKKKNGDLPCRWRRLYQSHQFCREGKVTDEIDPEHHIQAIRCHTVGSAKSG